MTVLASFFALACALTGAATAQPSPDPRCSDLIVGVLVQAPFVEKTPSGEYTGFAIELWEEIARRTQTTFTYREYSTVPQILDAVSTSAVDLAVTDLTVTGERLERMEFCQPFYHSGLTIMINEDRRVSFTRLLDSLRSSGSLELAGIACAAILALTVVVTVVLRRLNPAFSQHWHHGLAESFYHVVSVAMTGKTTYKGTVGPLGRVVAAIWILCGVAVVAYITSTVTSEMTANKLRDAISGPGDLAGKTVGVVRGTTSADYSKAQGWQTLGFDHLPLAVDALVAREIQAIVFDAPALQYYDHAHPELPLAEVGPIFDPSRYAFALPAGSPHRIPFNVALLQLEEAGVGAKLRAQYFGTQ